MTARSTLIIVFVIAVVCSCKKRDEYKNLNCSSVDATYSASIKPIIDGNCTSSGCHDASTGNANLTTYEGVLIRVHNGSLAKRVLYVKDMPKGGALSLQERQQIKCWIDAGAPQN